MARKRESHAINRSKEIISGIAAFVLAIAFTLFTVLLATYFGFFNTNNIITSFNKVDYYANVKEHFEEQAWDITIPLGLPKEVLDDIVNTTKISRDVKGGLTAGLDQTDYTIDTSKMTEALEANVRKYFAEQNVALDDNQETVLKEYQKAIETEYLSSVQIPLIKYFGYFKNLYQKVLFAGIPVCIILITAAITLVVKIRKWKHKGVRYLTYASLAAMLMTGVVPCGILISGVFKKLQLSPEYFYDFVIRYLRGGFTMFLYFSLIWLLVSALLLLIISKMKRKLRRRH